jgi:hypothetical protein
VVRELVTLTLSRADDVFGKHRVYMFDPVWGRNDLLWEELGNVLGQLSCTGEDCTVRT